MFGIKITRTPTRKVVLFFVTINRLIGVGNLLFDLMVWLTDFLL